MADTTGEYLFLLWSTPQAAGQWHALIGCCGQHRRPVARSNWLLRPTPQAVLRMLQLDVKPSNAFAIGHSSELVGNKLMSGIMSNSCNRTAGDGADNDGQRLALVS